MTGRAHEEEHRDREERVRPRGEAGPLTAGGGLRDRLAALGDLGGGGNHDLLRRPDDEPDVEPHEAAKHAAEEDLPTVRAREELAHAAVSVKHHVKDVQPARDEGEHRAPPEPPERPPDEAPGEHARPDRRLSRREEWSLDEVEVVQQADPGDASEEMKPAQQKQPAFRTEQRHFTAS